MCRKIILMTSLLGAILVGCQMNDEPEPGENNDSEIEEVEPDKEKEDEAEKSSNDDNEESQNNDNITKQEYSDRDEAANTIEDYQEIDETNIDLGHGIEGFIEGAAGHQYISWNEGRWLIQVDFPSDPENAVEIYEDGEDMAKSIVDYLEKNRLPAPDSIGVIKISGAKEHPEIKIKWQEDNIVYEIKEKVEDPIDALEIAIDYENNQ